MKPHQDYHDKKYQIVQLINSIWYRHGNGLDMRISVYHMVVNVHVVKLDGRGINRAESRFSVDLQAGGLDTVLDLAKRQMETALKDCGAEFMTISEFRV